MGQQVLVEIQPLELIFTFELKKQNSCSVQLVNKTNDYVAFKVKTTSPKRYCVRPNTGIILPGSTCNFTVTMQAQKEAPPDMQLKDKFLVQSTIVPCGAMDEDIVPSFFSKDSGRYIQENKLRVVLVSPSHIPLLEPINATSKELAYKSDTALPALKKEPAYLTEISGPVNSALKQEPAQEVYHLVKASVANARAMKEDPADDSPMSKNTTLLEQYWGYDIAPFHVVKDVDAFKLKLNDLELKLSEAEKTILRLREHNSAANGERDKFQQEIALLRRKRSARAQVGFPFLFAVFMALVGMTIGYLLHP